MTEKILLWIDNSFLQFGIANKLQNKEFELFGIFDINESMKEFFEKQKIVDFKKIWNFYECTPNLNPNLEYLKKIEKKYDINLWSIAYTDRAFYSEYNLFHKFNSNEILSIIENEIRFFENIFNEIKPKFLLMNAVTQHYQYLLTKICKKLGIIVLTIEPLRFGDRAMIVKDTIYDKQKFLKPITNDKKYKKTKEEIQDFLKFNMPGKFYLKDKTHKNYKINKLEKIKAFLEFLIYQKKISQKQYKNFGRTKLNVITKGSGRIHMIKKKRRESFMREKFVKDIDVVKSFVYFPLHYEPERVLLIGASFYADQISVIKNIAKSLPVDFLLLVKEHPVMETQGWRKRSFYKEIMDIPNVKLISPFIKTEEIMKKSSLIISISGTSALEAIFYEKPSIIIKPDIGYDSIPSICILNNIEDLPNAIKTSLKKKVSDLELNDYIDLIERNSFEYSSSRYSYEIAQKFNYNVGYLKQIMINNKIMKSFLIDFDDIIQKVTNEYIKKIETFKTS